MPARILGAALLALAAAPAFAQSLPDTWPDVAGGGVPITFPSHSPYSITDIGEESERNPETEAEGWLFVPDGASAADPVPAVVLLHGASGVGDSRELTYGAQFAAMGVAALVVDVFGARRDMAQGFIERALNITETMFLSDAYAGLHLLAGRPDIDADRIALMGFSYGGMATMYAAYEQVAEALAPDGRRFAAHVAFYGPCVARFEDHRATGAPVLILLGELDTITTPERCQEVADELEEGGADVTLKVMAGGHHQWDGRPRAPRPIGRTMTRCDFTVAPDGTVRDTVSGVRMDGPLSRRLILGLCTGPDPYLIGGDPVVRAASNREVSHFLNRLWAGS